ncbi:BgtTE-56117 [Blumeria graminis f. sp. tritici]|uniref:BgtTE-56117 n=1 Tax=Blumeria graminis f. sp. tritici TaxID=62690 RepID=A0A9X9MPS8_BLUGR|nr:BgtTE-56117 [Blumeria graminis f. sp. tritici]
MCFAGFVLSIYCLEWDVCSCYLDFTRQTGHGSICERMSKRSTVQCSIGQRYGSGRSSFFH